jgi:hypothetical protein
MHTLRFRRLLHPIAVSAFLLGIAAPAHAGPIAFDTWLEFAFGGVGSQATGCFPEDPSGPFCIPSSGTPTDNLDAPPWTFTAGGPVSLTVTDAFQSGDRFQVFDFGSSLGLTSVFAAGVNCGDDPVPCLANPAMSHGVFVLASGPHSITIFATASGGAGAGYLEVTRTGDGTPVVPEPATLYLLATGAGVSFRYLRRRP